jgi:hypothetical protein
VLKLKVGAPGPAAVADFERRAAAFFADLEPRFL